MASATESRDSVISVTRFPVEPKRLMLSIGAHAWPIVNTKTTDWATSNVNFNQSTGGYTVFVTKFDGEQHFLVVRDRKSRLLGMVGGMVEGEDRKHVDVARMAATEVRECGEELGLDETCLDAWTRCTRLPMFVMFNPPSGPRFSSIGLIQIREVAPEHLCAFMSAVSTHLVGRNDLGCVGGDSDATNELCGFGFMRVSDLLHLGGKSWRIGHQEVLWACASQQHLDKIYSNVSGEAAVFSLKFTSQAGLMRARLPAIPKDIRLKSDTEGLHTTIAGLQCRVVVFVGGHGWRYMSHDTMGVYRPRVAQGPWAHIEAVMGDQPPVNVFLDTLIEGPHTGTGYLIKGRRKQLADFRSLRDPLVAEGIARLGISPSPSPSPSWRTESPRLLTKRKTEFDKTPSTPWTRDQDALLLQCAAEGIHPLTRCPPKRTLMDQHTKAEVCDRFRQLQMASPQMHPSLSVAWMAHVDGAFKLHPRTGSQRPRKSSSASAGAGAGAGAGEE